MVALLQVVSGFVLVRSLLKIRSFFKDKDAADSIDIRALLRHAAAFGLYLGATVIDISAMVLVIAFPSETTLRIYLGIEVFWALMVFVS